MLFIAMKNKIKVKNGIIEKMLWILKSSSKQNLCYNVMICQIFSVAPDEATKSKNWSRRSE